MEQWCAICLPAMNHFFALLFLIGFSSLVDSSSLSLNIELSGDETIVVVEDFCRQKQSKLLCHTRARCVNNYLKFQVNSAQHCVDIIVL